MKMIAYLGVITFFSQLGCGDIFSSGGKGSDAYPEDCEDILPEVLASQQIEFIQEGRSNKEKVLAAQVAKLNLQRLKGTDEQYDFSNNIVDPYENSVATNLSAPNEQNKVLGKYIQFHGWVGAQTFYETEPGSNKFFIVDEVLAGTEDESLHSWYSTENNQLIRAKFKPEYQIMKKIKICGCGPNAEEMKIEDHSEHSHNHGKAAPNTINADNAAPAKKAFFLLPGSVPAFILNNGEMSIEYKERTIEKKYIPRKGYACHQHQVVC